MISFLPFNSSLARPIFFKTIVGSYRKTILFLDEIHRFNRAQQVKFPLTFFGCQATTNPFARIFSYLMSSKGISRYFIPPLTPRT